MPHSEYIRRNSGAAGAVLFVHGITGSPRQFDFLVELVPDSFAVYNILLEGHGKNVKDFSAASMEGWKKQVEDTAKMLIDEYGSVFICAHSMGTLFSYSLAEKYKDSVKALFLLGTPLKIFVKPASVLNTFKMFFGLFRNKETENAYKNAHSIKTTFRFWQYIGWIPRFLELFKESDEGRSNIWNVDIPCFVYQSRHDELVSVRSVKFVPEKNNIHLKILENSSHFIYSEDDMDLLKRDFSKMLE